jgi:hypothetical protein
MSNLRFFVERTQITLYPRVFDQRGAKRINSKSRKLNLFCFADCIFWNNSESTKNAFLCILKKNQS